MLYALGSNGAGQLGIGHLNDVSTAEPILIEGNRPPWKVVQLAAGGSHTVILCDDGMVRVTGDNHDGRCGLDGIRQITHFTDVPLPMDERTGERIKIQRVAATWASTILLSGSGEIYVCGTGESGELGLGQGVTSSAFLQRLPPFGPTGTNVMSVAAGMGHSVAILSNGEVFGWGKGRNGQLGSPSDVIWNPRKIEGISFRAVQAVCGKDFTLVAGSPESGDLIVLAGARNDRFRIKADAPSSISRWNKIYASWCSGYILKSQGEVVAWGRDDHGQLPPPNLGKLRAIAAGSEHCLALTESETVAAFGWGEHGNCGIPTDDRGDVKGTFNTIAVSNQVIKVFAGCATSFLETGDEGRG